MSAINLERRAWIGEAAGALLRDIRGLWVDPATGTIVTVSAQTMVSMRVFEGTAPAVLSSASYSATLTPTLADDLYTLPGGTGIQRLILGDDGSGLWGYDINSAGRFSTILSMNAPQAGRLDLQALVAGPAGRVYSAGIDGAGIGAMTNTGSALAYSGFFQDTETTAAAGITALATVSIGGKDFLVAGASAEAAVSVWEINPANAALTHTDSLGAHRSLGILRNTTDLETAIVGGRALVVLASTSSTASMGALTVLGVDEDGRLTALDHIIDTRDTRFGGVQSISVAEANGRTYVAAGGGDDGVSVFVLLASGRLVHLASFEDQLNNGLQNVSEVALMPMGSEMQIIVTAQGEGGVTQLVFDLPNAGSSAIAAEAGGRLDGSSGADALSGADGNDAIFGGNGDDILFDGAGRDTLFGGSGADVFTMAGDGVFDRIGDFNPIFDWLDLSGLPMLYDVSQLDIRSTSFGAKLLWRGEELDLVSALGGPLTQEQVLDRILTMPDRPPLVTPRRFAGTEAHDNQNGHEGQDEMTGEAGNDTLRALAGNDTLNGGAGYDMLYAGSGNDLVMGGNGRDKIWMGFGNDRFEDVAQNNIHGGDTVMAWDGNDTLLGWGGEDMLYGEAGNDYVTGGVGNDSLYGGSGYDTLHAGPGNDLVYGGNGRDYVTLAGGNDVFHDNTQGGVHGQDTVFAGAGNDRIEGGAGNDSFVGQDGNDLIFGRNGNDELYGGNGNDTLRGGNGVDLVHGGAGRDLAFLGNANDRYLDVAATEADQVYGGNGNDTIDAGGGDDTLWGEAGADVFVFSVGAGDRVIRDFETGIDRAEIMDQNSAFVREKAQGLEVDWGDGTVLLEGVTFLTLQTGDLVFV